MTIIASRDHLEYIFERALFEHDPAGTGCVFDNRFAQYATEAKMIADLYVDQDMDIKQALETVFDTTLPEAYDKEYLNRAYIDIEKDLTL